MGSEMCIRDRVQRVITNVDDRSEAAGAVGRGGFLGVVVGDDVAEGLDDERGDEVM